MIDQIKEAITKGHMNLREGSMTEADGKLVYIVDEMTTFFCTAYLGEDGRIYEDIRLGSAEGAGSTFAYPTLEAYQHFQRTGLDSGEEWIRDI